MVQLAVKQQPNSGHRKRAILVIIKAGLQAAKYPAVNANLPVSETAAKRVRKKSAPTPHKARKHGRSAKGKATAGEPQLAAPGSLTRTKALLLAALRVWELKHRISD